MAEAGKFRPKSLTYTKHISGGAEERLRELILYVCERCEKAPRFGKIKLNKIIWRADFKAFEKRRKPVTGSGYHKLNFGPAPVEMLPLLNTMLAKKQIEIEPVDVGGKTEQRVIALLPSHHNYFNAEDLEFIEESIAYYWDKSGTEASDDSHGIAWKSRHERDPMPYESVFFNDEPLPSDKKSKFAKMAKEKRWTSH